MSLPVPNLDDRNYEQLAAEARALIPRNLPAWTDYNASDPGITLLELFAFLIEATFYQINRVPERTLERFGQLVGVRRAQGEAIEKTLRRALEVLTLRLRAITEDDFEILTKQAAPDAIARAKAVVETIDTPSAFPMAQIVKVIIVPNEPDNPKPTPTPELRQQVFAFLRSRCLIATRLRVVEPDYQPPVSIDLTVVPDNRSRLSKVSIQHSVENTIRDFVSPLKGGRDGTGWEFGRPLFRSELYQVIEGLVGIDHVRQLLLNQNEIVDEIPLASPLSLVDLRALRVIVTDS